VALVPLAQGYAQFGYRWHAQYKPTSTLEIGPADGMGSSELLNPNPLLRLAEQRGTSVRYLAVGFGAGERGPTRFFEDSVAIDGAGASMSQPSKWRTDWECYARIRTLAASSANVPSAVVDSIRT